MSMIKVVTGNPALAFKVQGQRCNHFQPVRVRMDHNVSVKLQKGTLITPLVVKSIPKPEPIVMESVKEPGQKKKISNKKELNNG